MWVSRQIPDNFCCIFFAVNSNSWHIYLLPSLTVLSISTKEVFSVLTVFLFLNLSLMNIRTSCGCSTVFKTKGIPSTCTTNYGSLSMQSGKIDWTDGLFIMNCCQLFGLLSFNAGWYIPCFLGFNDSCLSIWCSYSWVWFSCNLWKCKLWWYAY